MATTQNNYTGNGSNKLFSITFPYLDTADIDVFLNGTLQTVTTQYTFANATTIEFVAAPANGAAVRIDRSTDDSTLAATFFPGSSIKAADLNADFDQTLYVVQEINNKAVKLDDPLYVNKTYIDNADALKVAKAGDTMSGNLAMGGNKVTGLGTPSANADAATKVYVDTVTLAGNVPDGDRGDITVSGVGTSWTIDAGAVTETKLGTGSVTSTKILDGTILNADVNASAGITAGKLSFTQAGTGATARTVDSKLKDVVSVKDFGAVGDGVADDTLAINRATKYVADLGGGTVYYPSGTYRITRAIRLDNYNIETFTYSGTPRRNVVHLGAGRNATTIKASGFYTSIFTSFPEPFVPFNTVLPVLKNPTTPGVVPADQFIYLAENIVIEGLTLDCDYNTNVDGGATYGSSYATWGGTWPNGTTGASIYAADNYQYPIYVYNVRGLLIKNCYIKNSWFNGIEVYRCDEVQIIDNTIQNCGDKANYLGYYCGIEFDDSVNSCHVTGNIIKNTGTGLVSNGGVYNYSWNAVQGIIVANNVFDTTRDQGIYAYDWIAGWQINNNEFVGIGTNGIDLATNAPQVSGRNAQYFKISNNLIRSYNTRNQVGAVGIRAAGGSHTVTDNSIFLENSSVTNNTWGILGQDLNVSLPAGSSQGILIANNFLSGRFPATGPDQGGGIGVSAVNSHATGNTIISTGNVAYTAIMIAKDDVAVTNNNIRGSWLNGSGKRAIYYNSGLKPYVKDARFEPLLDVSTSVPRTGLTGSNTVDFTNFTPTTFDNRGNFNTGTNAFVADMPGLYEFTAQVVITSLPDIARALFSRNGSANFGRVIEDSTGRCSLSLSAFIELSNTDSVVLNTYCASTHTVEEGAHMNVKFIRQLT